MAGIAAAVVQEGTHGLAESVETSADSIHLQARIDAARMRV